MRQAFSYFIALFFLTSCAKDTLLSISPTKNRQTYDTEASVKEYLRHTASGVATSDSTAITSIANAILFDTKKQVLTLDKKQVAVVAYDLNSVSAFSKTPSAASIVFFLQDGVVYKANIVDFNKRSINNSLIAISMLTDTFNPEGYTGITSTYSIAGKLILRNEILNGKLVKHGLVVPISKTSKPNAALKTTAGCTDWYLVTRVNGVIVSSEYLYSVCDCDGQTDLVGTSKVSSNIVNRTNCGGGGGTGGEPGNGGNPPANPVEGQTFNFIDKDGSTKKYVAERGNWVLKMVVLPIAAIYGNASTYPQFVSDSPPQPMQQIMGYDGYLYVYSGWSASWTGIPPQMEYVDPSIAADDPPRPPDVTEYDCNQLRNHHSDDPLQQGNVGTLQDLVNQSNGQTRTQVITQRGSDRVAPLVNLPLGPNVRYIYDPLNPDVVIDLRHMLAVGYWGPVLGNTLETTQYVGGQDSAFDHQDYFSNQLGYDFYRIYGPSVASQPSSFIPLLQEFLTGTTSPLGTEYRTRNTSPVLINQRCP